MSKTIDAMKQALSALEHMDNCCPAIDPSGQDAHDHAYKVMHTLRSAISHEEAQTVESTIKQSSTVEREALIARLRVLAFSAHIPILERAADMLAADAQQVPKGVLSAISRAGFTLIQNQHGYALQDLGLVSAQKGKP